MFSPDILDHNSTPRTSVYSPCEETATGTRSASRMFIANGPSAWFHPELLMTTFPDTSIEYFTSAARGNASDDRAYGRTRGDVSEQTTGAASCSGQTRMLNVQVHEVIRDPVATIGFDGITDIESRVAAQR